MKEEKIAEMTFDFVRVLRNLPGEKDPLQSLLLLREARECLIGMDLDNLIDELKNKNEKHDVL